jgi:hypothetical protein
MLEGGAFNREELAWQQVGISFIFGGATILFV